MGLIQMANNNAGYRDEHLTVDFGSHAAELDGQQMVLTRKEYELLSLLTHHAGEIVPRAALLLEVWGYGPGIRTRTLDVHIRRLRRKLGNYADQYIETIFGVGYRFQPYQAPRVFETYPGRGVLAIGA